MLNRIKRVIALLLAFVVAATGGLYLFSNHQAVTGFIFGLISPVVLAVQSGIEAEEAPPAPETEPASEPARQLRGFYIETITRRPAALTAAGNTGEDVGAEENLPAVSAAAPLDNAAELPAFVHKKMLSAVPDGSGQVIYILADGTEGNLWLAQWDGDSWRTLLGPIYCRIGEGGLAGEKSDGDSATPLGWRTPGTLYSSCGFSGGYPVTELADGDVWITQADAPGYNTLSQDSRFEHIRLGDLGPVFLDAGVNPSAIPGCGAGVFIHGSADLTAPTQGSVAIAEAEMLRLAALLDGELSPALGIFPAVTAGWAVEQGIPDGFVRLLDAVPGAREDARYATGDNFIGRPITGYLGYHVIVAADVGAALLKVQQRLEKQGLGLLVYDSYRPQRAVEDIFEWLDSDEPGNREGYYPGLEKNQLSGIYLAEYSKHRLGLAVDLTVCELETGQPLDMGTGFDFFSSSSWHSSPAITDQQKANRNLLRNVMRLEGFSGYDKEWWHFNYEAGKAKTQVHDFVIPQ